MLVVRERKGQDVVALLASVMSACLLPSLYIVRSIFKYGFNGVQMSLYVSVHGTSP